MISASGSTYFLQKPFDLDRLLSLARRHCSAEQPRGSAEPLRCMDGRRTSGAW
jgi:DNA-binding NtrC family response regulator